MTKFVSPENNKKAVFPVFPVPIYINRLTDEKEFNRELVQKVEALRNSDPEGVAICKKEYRTGYTSFFSRNQIQKDPEFSEIAEQIIRHGRYYAQTIGFSTENPPLNLITMFGTINVKGCYHELHRHRNSLISGTYYVSANKTSSRISFLDPKAGFRMHEAGGHIIPHFGQMNFRLTVHLGLIIPDGCAIRVGEETRHWEAGKVLAFDDSFEHEAWNRGESERIVLIFEAWHPDIRQAEIDGLQMFFRKRAEWLRRCQPGGRSAVAAAMETDNGTD